MSVDPERLQTIELKALSPARWDLRAFDSQVDLLGLAQSIAQDGVLSPLVVRPVDGRLEVVCGERRRRAADMAGIEMVPAIVQELDNAAAIAVALADNVQHKTLNPVDEAKAYQALADQNWTHDQIANRVGVSRSQISNLIRLLRLPSNILDYVASGALSYGHARVLLNAEEAEALAIEVIAKGLSVRDLERKVAWQRRLSGRNDSHSESAKSQEQMSGSEPVVSNVVDRDLLDEKLRIQSDAVEPSERSFYSAFNNGSEVGRRDPNIDQVEAIIAELVAMPVSLQVGEGSTSGTLMIEFDTLQSLHRLVSGLKRGLVGQAT